ncbi:MAG: UDP-N-acetylmuramoyl-tripeptide--D-alanyl-D-alanine ligase [Syntrophaceae bacterium]|nr:UDP-N-acetylmuramoyl-tripeptide--D-alanyl-D-alanine ligase [Syntrophaceae bacterium]
MRADEVKYSARQICSICHGEIIWGNPETVFTGISTDSRDIKKGDLFLPIIGEKFNGFDYVIPAIRAGARGSLVVSNFSDKLLTDLSDQVLIKIQDSLRCLTDLASTHRILFPTPLIAVTGSSGKTTVKEMIFAILSQTYKTLATKGNLNNVIGLPMTVLAIGSEHEAAVVEAGINQIGEMDLLAKAASPDVAVISTIGPVHLEGLKNVKNVAREKFKLIQAASKVGVAPFGVPELEELYDQFKGKIFTFSINDGDFRASNIKIDERTHFLIESPWGTKKITINMRGKHNISNALAAIAACLSLGSNLDQAARALELMEAPSWRMETVRLSSNRILIKDYYNANPQSMKAALETLVEFNQGAKKIAILGDMMELGELSYSLHQKLGEFAASLDIDKIVFIGQSSKAFEDGFSKYKSETKSLDLFEDKESAWKILRNELGAYDRILVKASRAMKMEYIADRIMEEI